MKLHWASFCYIWLLKNFRTFLRKYDWSSRHGNRKFISIILHAWLYLYKPSLILVTMIFKLKVKLNSSGTRILGDDVKHAALSKLLSYFLNTRINHITKRSRSSTRASNKRSDGLMQHRKPGVPATSEIKN